MKRSLRPFCRSCKEPIPRWAIRCPACDTLLPAVRPGRLVRDIALALLVVGVLYLILMVLALPTNPSANVPDYTNPLRP